MTKQKFVDIKVEGQDNIGVIDLGQIDSQEGETKLCNTIKTRLEPKMVKALSAHFDCEIRVISVNVISTLGHIEVRAVVIVKAEENDYQENITMEETWVY